MPHRALTGAPPPNRSYPFVSVCVRLCLSQIVTASPSGSRYGQPERQLGCVAYHHHACTLAVSLFNSGTNNNITAAAPKPATTKIM